MATPAGAAANAAKAVMGGAAIKQENPYGMIAMFCIIIVLGIILVIIGSVDYVLTKNIANL